MNKPQNYDETQAATGEFESLEPGGYICVIKKAVVEKTQNGDKEVMRIAFDIAEGEKKDFYKRKFDERLQTDTQAKWPGVFSQLTEGESLKFFKGVITSIEASNPGFKFDFDETKLAGKRFGAIFGREQYEGNDGNLKFSTKIRWIRSVDKIKSGDFKIPEDKLLPQQNNNNPANWNTVDDANLPF